MSLFSSDRNAQKIHFCKMKYFQFGFFPFFLPSSHSPLLERAEDKPQFFLLIFVQHFFQLPYNTTQKINGIFFAMRLYPEKMSRNSKNKDLLLFVMLETRLVWQIGCSISLWFQHNGEVINRIMDGKQGVLHVCFSLGGFQIS